MQCFNSMKILPQNVDLGTSLKIMLNDIIPTFKIIKLTHMLQHLYIETKNIVKCFIDNHYFQIFQYLSS